MKQWANRKTEKRIVLKIALNYFGNRLSKRDNHFQRTRENEREKEEEEEEGERTFYFLIDERSYYILEIPIQNVSKSAENVSMLF